MERFFNYDIMKEIKERWSSRSFDESEVTRDDLMALIEAARYAPSCFNEQPWRFLVADNPDVLKRMQSVLVPANQEWANHASALILIAAKKTFSINGSDNKWHQFDTGTAFGYMTLEAQRRGLVAHAMGGFRADQAREAFRIPEDYEILTVTAVGRRGDGSNLSQRLLEREHPGTRKDLEEILINY